ncbi:unnamed protein product, partial [Closterium sp. NIES-54]
SLQETYPFPLLSLLPPSPPPSLSPLLPSLPLAPFPPPCPTPGGPLPGERMLAGAMLQQARALFNHALPSALSNSPVPPTSPNLPQPLPTSPNLSPVPQAAHSQGLERMLAGAMLQQARPPWVIVLRGVPVEAIRGVVQALYCGTMDDGLMDRHIFHLLLLAHSLPIPLLKSLCLEALRSRLLSPANAVDTLVLARLVGSRALQALTQQYIVRHHADVALTDAWAMLSQEYPDVKGMLVGMVEARKKGGVEGRSITGRIVLVIEFSRTGVESEEEERVMGSGNKRA